MLARAHHEPIDHRGGDGVEAGGRLVVEDVARPQRDRPGDPHTLAHAARQLGRHAFAGSRQIHQRQRFLHAVLDFLFGELTPPQPQRQVVRHRQRIEQGRELKDVTDALAQRRERIAIERADGLAVNNDVARIRVQQADDVLERDALAGPGVADDHHRFGVPDFQRQALQHRFAIESLVQVLEFDHSSTTAQKASSTRMRMAE